MGEAVEETGLIFVDSSHWIAIFSPRDSNHDKALKLDAEMKSVTLWTTELVLIEFLNFFADGGSYLRSGAVGAVDALRQLPRVNIVPLSETLFDLAYDEYRRYADKGWSLTDCVHLS